MKDIESQFKDIKSKITLSSAEKDFHRGEIMNFMEAHPAKPAASIKSPFFTWGQFLQRHYALAAFMLLILGGTGVLTSANGAKPGDALFGVKVNMLERARIVLSFDQASKTSLEVKFIDERLKEFAEWSTNEDASPEEVATLSNTLASQILKVHDDIAVLRDNQDLDGALVAASDLQSTLAAHAEVLGQIDPKEASVDVVNSITDTVEDSLLLTKGIVDSVAGEMTSSVDDAISSETVDTKQQEVSETIENISKDIIEDSTNLDSNDKETIQDSLDNIAGLLSEADIKNKRGSSTEAFILSTQADQEANKLRISIEAEQQFGINSVDDSEGDTPPQQE